MGKVQIDTAKIEQGLAVQETMGGLLSRSQFFSWVAEAHLSAGHFEDSQKAMDKAFAHVSETGEGYWEAELHRLKGELLLRSNGSEADAEECFNQAFEVSKNQSAKLLPQAHWHT